MKLSLYIKKTASFHFISCILFGSVLFTCIGCGDKSDSNQPNTPLDDTVEQVEYPHVEDSSIDQTETVDPIPDADTDIQKVADNGPDQVENTNIVEQADTLHHTPVENSNSSMAKLASFSDCDELLESIKERALSDMEERIEENMNSALEYGGYCYRYYDEMLDTDMVYSTADGGGGITTNASPSPDVAETYSETNNQVNGVSEADFIKNDDGYIYILTENTFKIIDAWPSESARIISEMPVAGIPKKLFVAADHALVYSSLDHIGYQQSSLPYGMQRGIYDYDNDCTYGYNCDFTGDNRKLKVTMFDISDRDHPVLLREIKFSGSYINSRRIGTAVHTVLFSPEVIIPGIRYWPDLPYICLQYYDEQTVAEIVQAFTDLKEKNRKLIENTSMSDWLPSIEDTHYVNGGGISTDHILDCQTFLSSSMSYGQSLLTLVSLDMVQLKAPTQSTIMGQAGAVYASSDALYVSARQRYRSSFPWFWDSDQYLKEASIIHKFSLKNDSAGCEYSGSGVVKGRVLNQFSMDEHEGHLRIATTTGYASSISVHSTLSILKEESEELIIVGQVDNIAPTEDIRSVRFNGNRAFIVTFKKTDPLFVIDISEPNAPKIEGELKIPGYSTYMHIMDDTHLLTIGYDTDDQGSFAWFQGIMLQIFDVEDMKKPTLIWKEIIGTRGSSSEAATNHLAFNYFPPKDLLALPMTICEDSTGGGSYGAEMTFSGLIIYEATVENGFSEKGRVSHMDSESSNFGCHNWWTQSNSIVKRSIFMDDYVYSVAMDQIKIAQLENLSEDVSVIDLTSSIEKVDQVLLCIIPIRQSPSRNSALMVYVIYTFCFIQKQCLRNMCRHRHRYCHRHCFLRQVLQTVFFQLCTWKNELFHK